MYDSVCVMSSQNLPSLYLIFPPSPHPHPPHLPPPPPPPPPHILTHAERQYIQLYEAIRHDDLESLQTALSSGMPVDMRDKYNKTPLMIACSHGRLEVAKFFLDRGSV